MEISNVWWEGSHEIDEEEGIDYDQFSNEIFFHLPMEYEEDEEYDDEEYDEEEDDDETVIKV